MTDRSKWTPEQRAAERAKQKETYHANVEFYRAKARAKYHRDPEGHLEKGRVWAKANPEKIKKMHRNWLDKNPGYEARWQAEKRKRKPWYSMYLHARMRAKKLGLAFDLLEKDIVIPTHCPITGLKLVVGGTGKLVPHSASLDRVRPELGYVRDNVCVISWKANKLKSIATLEELEALVSYIRRHY